ncbi:hypothetical protein MSPP1_000594 [Malassezia sp. CBS 17886]|nr:hypothetical protein MSPP1_000594 [Malassezia sp. CBS 17886]
MSGTDAVERAEEAKQRGNAHFKAKQYRAAVDEYTAAVAADAAAAATPLLNRAAAYMALNEYGQAAADCRQAVALHAPELAAKARLRLAKCDVALGQLVQAREALSPVLQHGTVAEQAQAREASDQVDAVDRHITSAHAYMSEKNGMLASIALDQAQAAANVTDYSSPRAWQLLRAQVLLHRNQIAQAHSLASDMYRADPSSTDALVLGARVMLANNDVAKAVTQAQSALRNDPESEDAKRLLRKCRRLATLKDAANAAFKAGQSEGALAKYAELLELAQQDSAQDGEPRKFMAVIYSNRAILLAKLQRNAEAVEDSTRALALDRGYAKPLRTRARARLAMEEYEEAVRDYRAALDESAGTPDADTLRRELRQAELDLKRSKQKDHYKILGVPKSASESEIKKAFRRESLKHHPDKGGDEDKFKLCSEAYSILSDETKRRRYDAGADDVEAPDFGMGTAAGMGGGVNLADLFGAGFASFPMGPDSYPSGRHGGATNYHFG